MDRILKVPPPIWLLALIVLAVIVNAMMDWRTIVDLSARPLGLVLSIAGFGLTLWGGMLFAREKTEIVPTSPKNSKLVTDGPYRFSRNPMYLGMVMLGLGVAFYAGTVPFFAVPVLQFLILDRVFIPMEEDKMQRQFGQAFSSYRARVRRWV